jgi:ABC-type polysaccharide/polyol phosphate export permease
VPWAFFSGALTFGTSSLTANATLLTKVAFPREVLPVAAVLAHLVDLGAGLIAALALALALGVTPSAALLWVPALLLLLVMLTVGLALVLSCANLFFRDVKYLVQVFVTFAIFVTPVLMDASMYGPKGAAIVMLNPVAPLLEGLRLAVVEQHNLLEPYTAVGPRVSFVIWRPWYLAYSTAVAVFGLIGSAVLFHRSERRFAEII